MNIIEKKIKHNILLDDDTSNNTNNDANNNVTEVINTNNSSKFEVKTEPNPNTRLFYHILKRGPSCGLIVVDNFYSNAMNTRNFILTQDFSVKGNFPGNRTVSYATENLKEIIQKYVEPFCGKITNFPCPKSDNSNASEIYNGAFQYTTSRDRSWIHTDKWNDWAGVLFMTPNAPVTAGTAFYRFKDGSMCEEDGKFLGNQEEVDRCSQDLTKWELVDQVGNVFNRLVLFNAHRYHMSQDYFGDTKENGRLFQVFFFSTEKK
jgi:hypothetical protein